MSLRTLAPIVVVLALVATACGAGGDDPGGDSGTGTTGTVTKAQADEAMGGLCEIAAGGLTEMAAIHEAFHGRAHDTLHEVAAGVQEADPVVAGALLEAKAVVEVDLEGATPPPDLPAHAQALVATFASALETIGLQVDACG